MTNRKSSKSKPSSSKFTAEQKAEYFKSLRKQWQAAKAAAETNTEIQKIFAHLNSMNITGLSLPNIQLVLTQAAELGLPGMPYIDFKTYEHWKKSGYQVKRGEKSQVYTITWISTKKNEDENNDGYRFPKLTHLFHSSQVEAIN